MSAYITNSENDQFGPTNIPFGVVSTTNDPIPNIATRLYGQVLRLPDLIAQGLLDHIDGDTQNALQQPALNTFAGLGRTAHRHVRQALQNLFNSASTNSDIRTNLTHCAIDISQIQYHLPITVGDFSDFSCSKDHVLNAGEAVLGKRELPPGFLHFPIGYGGRSSSIIPPDTPVRRPVGQYRTPIPPPGTTNGESTKPFSKITFGPSRAVDFELEVACVVGKPSSFGTPINIADAEDHVFGFLLLNDWSARDIQGLEMNPLGPFNGKSFGTSISPWIITIDALQPYRTSAPRKENELAPYLRSHGEEGEKSHFAIQLQAAIEFENGNGDGDDDEKVQSTVVCESKFEWLYWTVNEMIAHQTINGCPLKSGDILATGTVSGGHEGSHGCLLEMTYGGKKPIQLNGGVSRTYLQNGDAVRLTGVAGTRGTGEFIGFGSCYGRLQESISLPLPVSRVNGVKDVRNGV